MEPKYARDTVPALISASCDALNCVASSAEYVWSPHGTMPSAITTIGVDENRIINPKRVLVRIFPPCGIGVDISTFDYKLTDSKFCNFKC
jgi:hypothetical protein